DGGHEGSSGPSVSQSEREDLGKSSHEPRSSCGIESGTKVRHGRSQNCRGKYFDVQPAEKGRPNGSRQKRAGTEGLRRRRQFVGLLSGHGRQPGQARAKRYAESYRSEEEPHLSL